MDFGHKNLDVIADTAQAMVGVARRAYMDSEARAGAKARLQALAKEITELLKALPE